MHDSLPRTPSSRLFLAPAVARGWGGGGRTREGRSLSLPAPPHPPTLGCFASGPVKTEL